MSKGLQSKIKVMQSPSTFNNQGILKMHTELCLRVALTDMASKKISKNR